MADSYPAYRRPGIQAGPFAAKGASLLTQERLPANSFDCVNSEGTPPMLTIFDCNKS